MVNEDSVDLKKEALETLAQAENLCTFCTQKDNGRVNKKEKASSTLTEEIMHTQGWVKDALTGLEGEGLMIHDALLPGM